jgi:hypothetical protein
MGKGEIRLGGSCFFRTLGPSNLWTLLFTFTHPDTDTGTFYCCSFS